MQVKKENGIIIEVLSDSEIAKAVKKCLTVLFGTRVGTQAMDRDFGLSWDFLDKPTEIAQAEICEEVMIKVKKYEPRANVEKITFEGSAVDGVLIPRIEVSINE